MRKLTIIAASVFAMALVLMTAATAMAQTVAPHGNYSSGTDYCVVCHDVHDAGSDYVLTREPTVTETCGVCHTLFGTQADGTWTTTPPDLQASNATASQYAAYENTKVGGRKSGHRLGITSWAGTNGLGYGEPSSNDTNYQNAEGSQNRNDIPGGSQNLRVIKSADYGYTSTNLYAGTDASSKKATNGLYCASCHTPHGSITGTGSFGNQLMSTDQAKNGAASGSGKSPLTEKLLSSRPNHGEKAVSGGYDSFCIGCHDQRDNVGADGGVSPEHNHPPFCTTCHGNGEYANYPDFPHTSEKSRLLEKDSDALCTGCHGPTKDANGKPIQKLP